MAKKISEKELINMDEVEEMVGVKNKCFKRFTLSAFKEWVKKIVNKRHDELLLGFWAGKNLYTHRFMGVSWENLPPGNVMLGDVSKELIPFVGSPVILSFTIQKQGTGEVGGTIFCGDGAGIFLNDGKQFIVTSEPQKIILKTTIDYRGKPKEKGVFASNNRICIATYSKKDTILPNDYPFVSGDNISVSDIRLELGY